MQALSISAIISNIGNQIKRWPMDNKLIITSKFDLGDIAVTTPLYAHCKENGYALIPYLVRHANGDWGDVCKEDWKSNDEALKNGERLLSEYKLPDDRRIWIITEWDRSATTLLFPEDY